jgi:hypothetical protein
MLDAFGHHKKLTGIEGDRPIPQLNVERAFGHKEKIVRLVVLMPVKRPLELTTMMSLLL